MDSIDKYNKDKFVAADSDVSFSVYPQNPVGGAQQYKFPFTRDVDSLPLMEQCQSMMRSSFQTHATSEDDTLEMLKTYVDAGIEWKPLNDITTLGLNVSRKELIRMITKYSADNPLFGLHDERFISKHSAFCENDRHKVPVSTSGTSSFEESNMLDDDLGNHSIEVSSIFDSILFVDTNQRAIGNLDKICPCSIRIEAAARCFIHKDICGIRESLEKADSDIFVDCINDASDVSYDAYQRHRVRELLHVHHDRLKELGFACEPLRPSNLWGISAADDSASIDVLDFMLRPRSGVSYFNYRHVVQNYHKVMGEGDRVVEFSNNYTKDNARNILCGLPTDEQVVHDQGFPVTSTVAESPVILSCTRYVMEVSWKDMLDRYIPIQVGEEKDEQFDLFEALHAESDALVESWREKCSVKLTKLKTCNGMASYSRAFLNDHGTLFSAKYMKSCPFKLSPELATRASIMYRACLVIHDDGRVFDIHLCMQEKTLVSTEYQIVKSTDMVERCSVVNPLSLLSDANTRPGVIDLPELSKEFVDAIVLPENAFGEKLFRKRGMVGTKFGSDFLFPEASANAQCFDTVDYWPETWQAPFGEILSDSYRAATGFSNYMAVVVNEESDNVEKIVTLPHHLRDEDNTANFFGTGGICREPTFGMPLVAINTQVVCTSPLDDASRSNGKFREADYSQHNEQCSSGPRLAIGGGMGTTIGHLWPLVRLFLHKRARGTKHKIDNTRENILLDDYREFVKDHFALDINLEDSDDIEKVVQTMCYTTRKYMVLEEIENSGVNSCVNNTQCTGGFVCAANGVCSAIDIEIESNYENIVEVGLNSAGCAEHDTVSGASPWSRFNNVLEQHGLCSHSNMVSYERMNMLISQTQSETKCTTHNADTENEHWICPRDMVNWTWARENPDSVHLNPSMDTRSEQNTYSVLESRLFDADPHLCDYDYLHSSDLGWCGLHLKNDPQQSLLPSYNSWARTAARHSDFSLLKMHKKEFDRPFLQATGQTDKLRFMGLGVANIPEMAEIERSKGIVQSCQSLGICQQEMFTVGGVYRQRHRSVNISSTVQDIISCGSIGYVVKDDETLRDECILDPQVAIFVYHLDNNPQGICRKLFSKSIQNILGVDIARHDKTGLLKFDSNNPVLINKLIGKINKVTLLHDDYIDRINTPNMLFDAYIRECAVALYTSIQQKPNLYQEPLKNNSGLYVFYQFGTYEIPLFWWLKYCISKLVYNTQESVKDRDIGSLKLYPVDAYEHRLSKDSFIISKMPIPTTLQTIWSRINTHELEIFDNVAEYMVQALEEFTMDRSFFKTSIVMNCPEKFKINSSSLVKHQLNKHNMTNLESTLDDVFYPKGMGQGLKIRGPDNVPMDREFLTSYHLFKYSEFFDEKLVGVSSVMEPVDPIDTSTKGKSANMVFMRYIIKKVLSGMQGHDTNQFNPLYHPDTDAIIRDNNKIKIMNFDLRAIMMKISQQTEDEFNQHIETFLKYYDEVTKCSNKSPPLLKPNPKACVGNCQCIFNRHMHTSLKHQGTKSGVWNKKEEPTVQLFTAESLTNAFQTINMCSETDMLYYGRNGMNVDSTNDNRENSGGRCTLKETATQTPGVDFVVSRQGTEYNQIPTPGDISQRCEAENCQSQCNTPEFTTPHSSFSLKTITSPHLFYAGQQYMTPVIQEGFAQRRRTHGLCHRIDSGCVTGHRKENVRKLFGNVNHPVDIKYQDLENNAYTQVNGRMFGASSTQDLDFEHLVPKSAQTSLKTIMAPSVSSHMYKRDVGAGQFFSDWTNHKTLWKEKSVSANGKCNLVKIKKSLYFDVTPYVLNPEFGNLASFSHVIYNDRVLMERSSDDENKEYKQQLFGHHFEGGTSSKEQNRQVTSPTPLFSYCPTPTDVKNNLHKFKLVSVPHGKTRMAGNQHRWNQETQTDGTLKSVSGLTGNKKFPLGMDSVFTAPPNKLFYLNSNDNKWSIGAHIGAFLHTRFVWTDFEFYPQATGVLNPSSYINAGIQPIQDEFIRYRTGGDIMEALQNFGGVAHDDKTFSGNNRLGNTDQDDFFAKTQASSLQTLGVCSKIPTSSEAWDLHELAMCYEMDPYEENNIRPWWSTTICDVIRNFMDRSTGYYFLDLLFKNPFPKNGNSEWRSSRNMPRGPLSLLQWYTLQESYDHANPNTYKWTDDDTEGPGGPREVMEDVEKRYNDYDKNGNVHAISKMWKDHKLGPLSHTDAMARIFSFNMLYDNEIDTPIPQGNTRPMSFSACREPKTGLSFFAKPGYCDLKTSYPARMITKPSIWSEMDGSPGDYLVACKPNDPDPLCKHILSAASYPVNNENEWEASANNGACSYSVSYKDSSSFCSLSEEDELDGDKIIKLADKCPGQHPVPQLGEFEKTSLWGCMACRQFDKDHAILTNINEEHCVGCGLYAISSDTQVGPLTETVENMGIVAEFKENFGVFADSRFEELFEFMENKIKTQFADKITLENNEILWKVNSNATQEFHEGIVHAFENFGSLSEYSANSIVGNKIGCTASYVDAKSVGDFCSFETYDASNAHRDAGFLSSDVRNGCIASEDQQNMEQYECKKEITENTTDLLKRFTDEVYGNKYGLKLPLVGPNMIIEVEVNRKTGMSWTDGVLPFYAEAQRAYGNSKENDFLAHLFNEKRCAETYHGKALRDYACFFNKNGSVEVVVPWIGHDYSFLKRDNYKMMEYTENNQIEFSDMDEVGIGTDMCHVDDFKKIPCSGTICIDKVYEKYDLNKSICIHSKNLDAFYNAEISDRITREGLEKLHETNNLYNPEALLSHCYIKYTKQEDQLNKNHRCGHRQAPLGYRPEDILSRATPAISLNRTMVRLGEGVTFRDFFRAQKTRYSSLWGGHSAFDSVENNKQQIYSLMAVHPGQLAPTKVRMRITSDGDFRVVRLGLLALNPPNLVGGAPDLLWVNDMYKTINYDLEVINRNPIYNTDCSEKTNSDHACGRHWACPYILSSLFGGSSKASRTNPTLKLLTPDPVRMRLLYPELGGCHPVVRTRNVSVGLNGDIMEYSQFGPALFITNSMVETTPIKALPEIYRILKMFTLGHSLRTRKITVPVKPTMDWPNLQYKLRSKEAMNAKGTGAPMDSGMKFDNFWVAVRQLALETNTTDKNAYSKNKRSTLDSGGDCHRSPMLKMNQNVLDLVLSSDVCYVRFQDNRTTRQLECSNSSMSLPIIMTLSTTTRHRPRPNKQNNPYKCNSKAIPHTYAYGWDSARNKMSEKIVESELSLSERIRISPLWNMLQRFDGIQKTRHLDPSLAWTETSELRLTNAKWAAVTRHNTPDEIWNTNWVIQNTEPTCEAKISGSIPKHLWNNNPDKGTTCFNLFNQPEHTDACMKTLVNPFDICQIKEFEDFCRKVNAYRTDLININAWANDYTKLYKNLYVPSVFIKEDGIFGWNAVIQTYESLGLDVSECPDVNSFVMKSNVKVGNFKCPSQALFQISVMVSGVRTVIMKLVDVLSIISKMCINMMFLVISLFMGNDDNVAMYGRELGSSFKELLKQLAKFYEEMMKLIFNFLRKTFFNEILVLIETLCEFAKQIAKAVFGFVASFLNIVTAITKFLHINDAGIQKAKISIENLRDNVDNIKCKINLGDDDLDKEPFETLSPSTCWIQQSGFSMPSDILGGLLGDFTCGATSMCLPDTADVQGKAIVCMRCDAGSIGGYGCDLATKQCVCGLKTLQSSTCIKNDDCWKAGAVCTTYASFYSFSFGTQPCMESVGSSYCKKESPGIGTGTCVTYKNEGFELIAKCDSREIEVAVKPVHMNFLCLGTTEEIKTASTIIRLEDTFAFACRELTGSQAKTACLNVLQTTGMIEQELRFVSYSIRSNRRTLLSSDFGDGHLVQFFESSLDRIPSIVGDCRETLQICINNSNPHSHAQCLYCIRVWWFWNTTLQQTSIPHTILDTDLLDLRNSVIQMTNSAHILPHILQSVPFTLGILLKDWIRDDIVFGKLTACISVAYLMVENFLHPPLGKTSGGGVGRSLLSLETTQQTRTNINPVVGNVERKIDLSIFKASDQAISNIMQNAAKNVAAFESRNNNIDSIFESTAGASCVIDYGVVFNSIIRNFATFLDKDGWKTKKTCTQAESMLFSGQELLCPIVQQPLRRVLENTNVLIKYYQYMALSTCLKNMSISCIPPAAYSATGIFKAIPSVSVRNASVVLVVENDVLSSSIIDMFYTVSSVAGFNYLDSTNWILSFASIDALHNETLYREMTLKNYFSLGRITRDLLTCDFEDTIYCEKKNLKLLDSFMAMFVILLIISYTIPVPSVPYYFMWVLGLSYGTLYLSYNYSILCSPRIPTCLGNGIHELTQTIFPAVISMPRSLYDFEKCDNQLNLRLAYQHVIPRPVCSKSCLEHPFGTGPILNIIASIEIVIRRERPSYTLSIIQYTRFISTSSQADDYIKTIDSILDNYIENVDDYQLGLVVCIVINSYKIISLIIFLILLLPFIAKIFFMAINTVVVLLMKTIFIAKVEKDTDDLL